MLYVDTSVVIRSLLADEEGHDQARDLFAQHSRIVTAYVGRNAALPLFTQLAISIGFVVGGSIVIEQLFAYEGVGRLLFNSIQARDYPVMQGVFLIITIAVVGSNLLADLLYSRLDPRIRRAGKG